MGTCNISGTAESWLYRPVCVPVAHVGRMQCAGRHLKPSCRVLYPCYFYRETDEYFGRSFVREAERPGSRPPKRLSRALGVGAVHLQLQSSEPSKE